MYDYLPTNGDFFEKSLQGYDEYWEEQPFCHPHSMHPHQGATTLSQKIISSQNHRNLKENEMFNEKNATFVPIEKMANENL